MFFLYEALQQSIIDNENVSATESAYLYIHCSVTANDNCEGEDGAGSVYPQSMGRPKTYSLDLFSDPLFTPLDFSFPFKFLIYSSLHSFSPCLNLPSYLPLSLSSPALSSSIQLYPCRFLFHSLGASYSSPLSQAPYP